MEKQEPVPNRARSPLGATSTASVSSKGHSSVRFQLQPNVAVIEPSLNLGERGHANMATQLYETFAGNETTDDMLAEAANLFSENYGTWGEKSSKPGQPVRLSARRLRKQYLPDNAATAYTRVTVDGNLAGNAFACRWKYNSRNVCWVTQLVVSKDYRERGLAGGLLKLLRADSDDIYGIMSSHPAACLAAATSFSTTIEKVSLDFIGESADAIMKASPVSYIRDAKLCGAVFDTADSSGLVSGVNTGFFVDHEEPLEALAHVRQSWQWPLGELPDGYEYLLVLRSKIRRSRSRSSTRAQS